jgi:hypothetical protein
MRGGEKEDDMRIATLSSAVILAIGLSGCSVEAGDEPVGTTAQAEIDPGTKDYIIYNVVDANLSQLAQVLVTATAGGGYAANREYWYVTTNLSNTSGATFEPGTSENWTTPPSGLGTLSFTMASSSSWTSGSFLGRLPTGFSATGVFLAMNWQMVETAGVWSGNIIWWNGNSTGTLFGGTAATTLTPGHVSGSHYYFDNTPL